MKREKEENDVRMHALFKKETIATVERSIIHNNNNNNSNSNSNNNNSKQQQLYFFQYLPFPSSSFHSSFFRRNIALIAGWLQSETMGSTSHTKYFSLFGQLR
jgi:hypothetical protein